MPAQNFTLINETSSNIQVLKIVFDSASGISHIADLSSLGGPVDYRLTEFVPTASQQSIVTAGGMDALFWYAYEDSEYLGNPYQNSATSTALNDVHTRVVGKIMTRCSILNDGTVWATFSDGSSWNV